METAVLMTSVTHRVCADSKIKTTAVQPMKNAMMVMAVQSTAAMKTQSAKHPLNRALSVVDQIATATLVMRAPRTSAPTIRAMS